MNLGRIGRFSFAFAVMFSMMFGALVSSASAQQVQKPGQEVCGALDSGKIDTIDDVTKFPTLTVTAPDGWLISGYCVKAGAEPSMPEGVTAVQYVAVEPAQKNVEISHSTGKDISHYALSYVPEPVQEVVTVYGCSQGYYKNWGAQGFEAITLGDAGFATPYATNPTFAIVLANPGSGKVDKKTGQQTYDGYVRQAVTAYINASLNIDYAYTTGEVVAGYNSGSISQGDFEWNNHGVPSEGIEIDGTIYIGVCPFSGGGN